MKTAALVSVSQSYDVLSRPTATAAVPEGQHEAQRYDRRLPAIESQGSESPRYEPPVLLRSFGELVELATAFSRGSNAAKAIEAMLAYALDRDLLNGISIGVIINGRSYIRTAGRGVTPASKFEIGSLTKIYTAELLKAMVVAGKVGWNDPVTAYLSNNLKAGGRFVPMRNRSHS